MSIADCWRAFKAVSKIKEEIKTMEEKKPGWKTSEFWLGLLGIAATVGAAVAPFVPPAAMVYVASVAVIVPSVYAVARTIAKQTTTTKDDEFLDKLAAKLAPLIKLDGTAKIP